MKVRRAAEPVQADEEFSPAYQPVVDGRVGRRSSVVPRARQSPPFILSDPADRTRPCR